MGYRNYLQSIPKKEYLKLKDKTEKELIEYQKGNTYNREILVEKFKYVYKSDDYFDLSKLNGLKELYEFGKYCDFDTSDIKKFFVHEMSWEGDIEFSLANKKFLIKVINDYRLKVAEYYKKLSEKPHEEIKRDLLYKSKLWNGEWIPYNLDLKKEHLVDSWEYEHTIFDLVRILKSFDFKKNVLIYSGG